MNFKTIRLTSCFQLNNEQNRSHRKPELAAMLRFDSSKNLSFAFKSSQIVFKLSISKKMFFVLAAQRFALRSCQQDNHLDVNESNPEIKGAGVLVSFTDRIKKPALIQTFQQNDDYFQQRSWVVGNVLRSRGVCNKAFLERIAKHESIFILNF